MATVAKVSTLWWLWARGGGRKCSFVRIWVSACLLGRAPQGLRRQKQLQRTAACLQPVEPTHAQSIPLSISSTARESNEHSTCTPRLRTAHSTYTAHLTARHAQHSASSSTTQLQKHSTRQQRKNNNPAQLSSARHTTSNTCTCTFQNRQTQTVHVCTVPDSPRPKQLL